MCRGFESLLRYHCSKTPLLRECTVPRRTATVLGKALDRIAHHNPIATNQGGAPNARRSDCSNQIYFACPIGSANLGRFPIGWIHPIARKTLQINKLEHGLINENSDISEFFQAVL